MHAGPDVLALRTWRRGRTGGSTITPSLRPLCRIPSPCPHACARTRHHQPTTARVAAWEAHQRFSVLPSVCRW